MQWLRNGKRLELQPDFAKAHAGLGLVYLRQNKTKLALEHYRQAVALEPQFLEAHQKIAIILLNQARYAEATDAYLTIISLKPDDAEAYHNLGLCYAHQAREGDDTSRSAENLTDAALAALEKAVALSASVVRDVEPPIQPPFLTETYYLIGELQASRGDFDVAEKAYLSSGLPKAYHALAQLSAKVANRDKVDPKRGLETARRYAQKGDWFGSECRELLQYTRTH